jgi:hypothetical protein
MLATDPLSLIFLGCIVFSGAFLLISMATGSGHGHLHVGQLGHAAHVGHVAQAGHVAHGAAAHHVGHAAAGHPTAGTASSQLEAHASAGGGAGGHAPWLSVLDTLAGSLSPISALTFLFIFGLLGYLLHDAARAGVVLSVVLPALLGLLSAAVVGVVLTRLIAYAGGELTVENTRPEGRIGKVSRAIHPSGVGEVIFAREGAGRQSIGATSVTGQSIALDTEVVILSLHEGIASVQPWDDFIREARAGRTPSLGAIEPGP